MTIAEMDTAEIDDLLRRLSDKFVLTDDCWEWTASKSTTGYGLIWLDGKSPRAHRVLYELIVGPIPTGLVIDHLCRNRACVRPSHMEPVTHRENILRGGGDWRSQRCRHGMSARARLHRSEHVPSAEW